MRNPFYKRRGEKNPKQQQKIKFCFCFSLIASGWKPIQESFNYPSFVWLFKTPQTARMISGTRQRWLLKVTLVLKGRLLGLGLHFPSIWAFPWGNEDPGVAPPFLSLPRSTLSLVLRTEQEGAPTPPGLGLVINLFSFSCRFSQEPFNCSTRVRWHHCLLLLLY